jgi:DNA-binding LacI/PurR family transcriptional regulator
VDNVNGAKTITEHLIAAGHRRIAVFCGNADFCSNDQRIAGYRLALAEAGIPFDASLLYPGEYHREWGARNAALLLDRLRASATNDAPTAVFCLCDTVAVGALQEFERQGVRVPTEISVVGFDDIPMAETLGLTTMHHDIRAIGASGVETLLGSIQGTLSAGTQVLQPPRLIVRSTVSAPLKEIVR